MNQKALADDDDFDHNAMQMLQGNKPEHDGTPPPAETRVGDSRGKMPQSQQETIQHSGEPMKIGSPRNPSANEIGGSGSPNNLTKPEDESTLQVTGEFSSTDHLQGSTKEMLVRDATGDFSYRAAEVTAQGSPGLTVRNSARSGGFSALQSIPKRVGSFDIKRILGRGGMGVVYLARQSALNRDVALKMVLAGGHASSAQLQRFKSEAKAVAKLQHPNIVQVFEVGEENGLPFFSLEFVDGMSLDQRLDGKPLPPREAAQIVETLCRAMQYAHDQGILHRDLKPANILLTKAGDPKITDFGLAKQLEDDDSANTRTGTIMGTPSYMSPEQAQGMMRELTAASDQYSLGAMLYELLTGRPPFLGTKAFDTISQVVHKEPVPPHQLQEKLPFDIDTICLKALNKTPSKRYRNCTEMAEDLRRFLSGQPILARPISQVERAWRWCRRNPLIAAPSALAVTLLVATAIIASWSASIIADERDEANNQRILAVDNANKAEKEKAEAEKQRLLADEAKLQAEKNQKLAEKQALLALQNIQLVVTEVDDRLAKEPGMSPIRVGMLEVLEKQWDALDVALAGGIQGEAIPTLMAVRSKIADAWTSVDRIKEANAQYEVIYKQAKERLLVKNRSDASRSNLALICVRWAPIRQRLSGDPAEAEKLLNESNELLREILADPRPEPNSPKMFQIADTLQQSLMRVASMHLKKGALDKARDLYQEIEKICSKVLDEIAQPADWYSQMPDERKTLVQSYFQQNRDLSLAGQANILCRLGKSEDAIPIYDRVIEGRKENAKQNPKDRNARDQLALQLRNYGQNMMRLGRAEDAVRLIGQAHDLTEQNFNEDPTNAAFKRSHGHSLYYWGVARDAAGQRSDSIVLFERSRALRQEMVEASPDQSNKVNLMLSESRLGKREAGEVLVAELSASPAKDPDLRLDLARALAQLYRNNMDNDAGPALLEKSLTAIERAIEDGLADSFAVTSEQDLAPLRENPKFISMAQKLSLLRASD